MARWGFEPGMSWARHAERGGRRRPVCAGEEFFCSEGWAAGCCERSRVGRPCGSVFGQHERSNRDDCNAVGHCIRVMVSAMLSPANAAGYLALCVGHADKGPQKSVRERDQVSGDEVRRLSSERSDSNSRSSRLPQCLAGQAIRWPAARAVRRARMRSSCQPRAALPAMATSDAH